MKLLELLSQEMTLPRDVDRNITGLAIDSRQVQKGYLFFAYRGTHHNGLEYVHDAIKQGAAAVLLEGDQQAIAWQQDIPCITIPQLRQKVSELAARFYHYPAKSLKIVGITGTNGKTSCSHFIAASLQQLGIPCGVIGTLGNGLYGNLKTTNLTTPDPITLHAQFADFVAAGAKAVAMEVSSHSLDQGRVNGIEFEVAVFTNLTRDHLDYHGSMEAYGQAKRKLFTETALRSAVINMDDSFGQALIDALPHQQIVAYSADSEQLNEAVPLVYVKDTHLDGDGIHAQVFSPWGDSEICIPLIGQFNLSNALAVLATLCLMDIPFSQAINCLSKLAAVPGRMQTLGGGQQPLIVVDYAHTPDALEKVLLALQQHCQGKLHCLFGCGGDRDRGKRPLMAQIAEQYSDRIIVTDDNPRTESAQQIVDDILQGFNRRAEVIIEHNRSKAIRDIIQYAKAGDCVLIAGKGAETYQQIGNDKLPFSDIEQVKSVLR